MMKISNHGGWNIIKDEKFFQTKTCTVIKEIRYLFRLKKGTKAIKDRIFKDN